MKRVEWIDSLKGIAILMVIAVHVSQTWHMPAWVCLAFSFGAMGVQLFFLLSAYCMCMTWVNGQVHSVKDLCFWLLRKYKRLIPWYAVGVVLYTMLAYIGIGTIDKSAYTPVNIVPNLFLVNGFISEAQNSIVPGGWSISCIALFVFSAPLFMNRLSLITLVGLFVVGMVGIAISIWGYRMCGWSRFYTYCSPYNQAIVFVLGVAYWFCYTKCKRTLDVSRIILLVIAISFCGLAVLSVLLDKEDAIFYRHILVSLGFIAIIEFWRNYYNKSWWWVAWIGRHSYEIFIVHFAIIWTVRKFFS